MNPAKEPIRFNNTALRDGHQSLAAVMPNVRIIRVTPAAPVRDTWQTSALLRNLNSHKIR